MRVVVVIGVLPGVDEDEAPFGGADFGFDGDSAEGLGFSEGELLGTAGLAWGRFAGGTEGELIGADNPVGGVLDGPAAA